MADTPLPVDRDVLELRREVEDVRDAVGTLERWRVSVDGLRGENGKIGHLRRELGDIRRELATWKKAVVGIAIAAIGAVGGAAKAIDSSGERRGRLESQVQQQRRDIADLRAEFRAFTATFRWSPPRETP